MRIGQIIDRSLRLLPSVFGPLAAWYVLLSAITVAPDYEVIYSSNLLYIIAMIGQIVLSFILYFTVTIFASDLWLNKESSPKAASARITLSLVGRSIVLALRITVMTIAGILCLIFPGLIYALNRLIAGYILIIEDTSVDYALKQSKYLMTRGKWYRFDSPMMRLSGIGIILIILFLILFSIGGGLVSVSGFETWDSSFASLFKFVVQFIGQIVSVFSDICFVGFYYDLKARYEGSDLVTALEQMSDKTVEGS